ncbi:hypothetical protein JN06_01103 [Bacteroides zoogleoformans]|uniref:Peptidase S9 prolyl oligopeptidase catalytic domain-containing protein n=1 Tax=Bacteroides zoogleoformans TaxID=28119 RepID=A0ABM6T4R2_9BACE|nr:alpha/beta hydrolase [Bacteroides zoogleoformans]AVM51645.1 hypothetical protein C4H11_00520 [Bacteroides zoogleoformans]TWJ16811.1 hypothetical protein JN06_01103 [Bacteroides zoogleoformans]
MRRTFKYSLAGMSVLILSALIGGSFYMLHYSLTPRYNKGKDIAGSYKYMFNEYPFIQPWADSLQAIGALRDTFIVNDEGKKLHALFAEAPEPTDKTAIIVHGYTDNAVRMLMIGYMYNKELKYNILLPDLQNHGLSEGNAIQMGWKDCQDIIRWRNVASDLFKKPYHAQESTIYVNGRPWQEITEYGYSLQIVLHGVSMGAATAMMMSGYNQDDSHNIICYVADCGYTGVWDEFAYQLKQQFGLPEFPLLYTTSLLCKIKYGWTFGEASALKQIQSPHAKQAMLFIHGEADTYVPATMVHSLYEARRSDKELWIVPGTAHAESYKNYPQEYTKRVKNFVERYIH